MADELKPCPFCGDAEPNVYDALHSDDKVYQYLVECATCSASVYGLPCISDSLAAESAVESWNRRAGERTCRIVMVSTGFWECDACGGGIDWDSYDEGDPPNCNYCPNCGAKAVVD